MLLSGEYFYSIAALFSLSAYLLGNILWLRILLVVAALFYIFSGVSLGITSMVGWNTAYLLINAYHVVLLLLEKSTINLPDNTKDIYQRIFSSMSTREFKKLITVNPMNAAKNDTLIVQGETTDKLFIIIKGEVQVSRSGQLIAVLVPGDLIGEMSFMSSEPASANAVATDHVQYTFWSHEDLEKLKHKNCAVYNKFISIIGRDLVRKLNRKNQEILDLMS